MKRALTTLLFATILLAGCTKKNEFPIPVGVQTVRAILQPVPFSLKRRGTHALLGADGKIAAYAESTAVNLHALEGRMVELQGTFEKNSDPAALPVLVVTKILNRGEDEMRLWKVPALGLSLQVPHDWKASIQGQKSTFTASGSTAPVLTITLKALPPPSAAGGEPLYGPSSLPDGRSPETLTVGSRKAMAVLSVDAWIVRVAPPAVPAGGKEVDFTFAIRPELAAEDQVLLARKILASVEFSFTNTSARSSSSATVFPTSFPSSAGSTNSTRAAGEGAPCGGIAGILCPKGLLCSIKDPATDSGICIKR